MKIWKIFLMLFIWTALSASPGWADIFWPPDYNDHSYVDPTSSSHLEPSRVGDYEAGNLVDGSVHTAWSEGVQGDGIGQWIQFDFSPDFIVDKIGIRNGYQKKNRYRQNGRVKEATIVYSDHTTQKIYLKDTKAVQYINCKPIPTRFIRIVIDDVFRGTKWRDTCISEIDLYLKIR